MSVFPTKPRFIVNLLLSYSKYHMAPSAAIQKRGGGFRCRISRPGTRRRDFFGKVRQIRRELGERRTHQAGTEVMCYQASPGLPSAPIAVPASPALLPLPRQLSWRLLRKPCEPHIEIASAIPCILLHEVLQSDRRGRRSIRLVSARRMDVDARPQVSRSLRFPRAELWP